MSLPAYKKTQETLSQAGQKTSAAFTTMSSAISRKLGDMRWWAPKAMRAMAIPPPPLRRTHLSEQLHCHRLTLQRRC
ncbi:uncharacterized protein LOC133473810 isoform X6 [Phyllopteryx taeniolatus]|uniref:uncharacterized protein LOC133473810 isoform X6 n=1 Tax=Phyllopteryx taeniolatus TaxID=161469 RepID=UPI002AD2DA6E|nr:uncharacterized protein LOC133473810 isoform X6 [Phyllopteryx taeniolatus]